MKPLLILLKPTRIIINELVEREPKHTKNNQALSLHLFLALFFYNNTYLDPCLWFILVRESRKPTELVQTLTHRMQETLSQAIRLMNYFQPV